MQGIKQRSPQIRLHCFSASEILAIAEYSSLGCATRLPACAMLASIPFPEAAPKSSTTKCAIAWRASSASPKTGCWVHRTAHQLGMRTTATMMFGVGETYEHRINHLDAIYRLQEETGGFTAFIPWSFQPANTALGGRKWDEATAVEYLKVLAISRLYLSNFLNVQASWVTQGLKVCLHAGVRILVEYGFVHGAEGDGMAWNEGYRRFSARRNTRRY